MLKESLFYAKILLFGEYGIIQDSMGLSIPYNSFKGSLKFNQTLEGVALESNEHLQRFGTYLTELSESKELSFEFDSEKFDIDVAEGMSFDSSIPQGFGVGSSGALVAAIYNRYANDKIDFDTKPNSKQISKLKSIFGQMESYFHGKSSGLDPLICYLNLPVLIKSKEQMGTVGLPTSNSEGKGAIFLINSGQPGETEPMINIFMEKMKQEGFRNMLKQEFKKYNDACIQAFLKRDMAPLFSNIKSLSSLLLKNFTPMIPSMFHKLWKEGIESNAYYLKLCGSGGGGYFLGFTQDLDEAQKRLKDYPLEVVFTF
ncbi:MAG: mevalonate kinase [Bacteroidetes bacterium]|jgi:mevalonate kinase|nr:mevalonate kinase [Bacteroidota bacterium]